MTYVLTFDLGTSYFKAAIFDQDLNMVALARLAAPRDEPQAGWGQIDAARFQDALFDLAALLRRESPRVWPHITALCFATQANSVVLLDEANRALTPIVLWNDRRAAGYVDRVRERIEGDDFYSCTGIPAITDGFCPGKLLWLQDHQPQAWRAAAKCCLISDYFTLLLTGRHVTEASVAALSGLLDIHSLQWRDAAIAALNAEQLVWPQVVRSGCMLGTVRSELAERMQLPAQAKFAAGCLDQYAGFIGTGNVQPGHMSETTGTVLATVSLSDRFDDTLGQRGVYQAPAFRDGWYYRMLFSEVSANLLEVLRNSFAPDHSYEQLCDLAAAVAPGCNGLKLNISTSAALHRPVFVGDVESASLGHRVRAILEGVADVLHKQVQVLAGSQPPPHITAAGGGSQSKLWLKIKSDLLGIPVRATAGPEPTSRGAAALAVSAITQQPLAAIV
ncbi:MAG: FGGY-family carbohydrate kinase [Phycisphaeraceae bacterium]|nr:FGGY-family carbohydrate kinase [Phycisphaeraceae bacterium]